MAQYKTHTQFNLLIALPVLLVAAFYFFHPEPRMLLTFSGTFVYSTLFMNPDLDLANQIRLFSLRGLLSIPFRSYALFFKHRGLSHHVLLGSLTRILWLIGWGSLAFFIVYKTAPSKRTFLNFYKHYQPFVLFGLAGIILADWCHLLLDRKEK